MGLVNDVTEGVSELIKYGNVGGLIRNVTHGVSNSAAKVFFSPVFFLCPCGGLETKEWVQFVIFGLKFSRVNYRDILVPDKEL